MSMNETELQVQTIRAQYEEKQPTELDALKKLDTKVKCPANVFAYTFGSISAIIMGAGMSLVMTDVGSSVGMENTMFPGIAVGVAGMVMALVNYPIYKSILKARKQKFAPKILELSEKIMKG